MPEFAGRRGALLSLEQIPDLAEHPEKPAQSAEPFHRAVYRHRGQLWVATWTGKFNAVTGTYDLNDVYRRPLEIARGDQLRIQAPVLDVMTIHDQRFAMLEFEGIDGAKRREWFPIDGQATHLKEAPDETESGDEAGPKLGAVVDTVKALWGGPPPKGLVHKDRNAAIREHMAQQGLSNPSDTTIGRAVKTLTLREFP